MKFSSPKLAVLMLVLALCCTLVIPSATAQRLSDKDVEALLGNLKSDTKKFRSSFNSAVSKSTIRKTSQEKDAKALVERFEKQTESALDEFKDKKKLDGALTTMLSTATQIDGLLTATPMGDQTTSDWARVKTELSQLAKQFDVTYPSS